MTEQTQEAPTTEATPEAYSMDEIVQLAEGTLSPAEVKQEEPAKEPDAEEEQEGGEAEEEQEERRGS